MLYGTLPSALLLWGKKKNLHYSYQLQNTRSYKTGLLNMKQMSNLLLLVILFPRVTHKSLCFSVPLTEEELFHHCYTGGYYNRLSLFCLDHNAAGLTIHRFFPGLWAAKCCPNNSCYCCFACFELSNAHSRHWWQNKQMLPHSDDENKYFPISSKAKWKRNGFRAKLLPATSVLQINAFSVFSTLLTFLLSDVEIVLGIRRFKHGSRILG